MTADIKMRFIVKGKCRSEDEDEEVRVKMEKISKGFATCPNSS